MPTSIRLNLILRTILLILAKRDKRNQPNHKLAVRLLVRILMIESQLYQLLHHLFSHGETNLWIIQIKWDKDQPILRKTDKSRQERFSRSQRIQKVWTNILTFQDKLQILAAQDSQARLSFQSFKKNLMRRRRRDKNYRMK